MVEIITIGDEILIGQIVDTNSAWIAAELNKIGLSVSKITSIHDEEKQIISALDAALSENKIVFLTGGLGPTNDDITKNTLSAYFNTKLIFSEEVYKNIQAVFNHRPDVMNPLTKLQAMVPENCTIIQNSVGSAPIMWFEEGESIVISMPGVPFEMKKVMQEEILPALKQRIKKSHILHKTIQVIGIGESSLAIKIEKWEKNLPSFLHLAYLPNYGVVKLRLSGSLEDSNLLKETIDTEFEKLKPIIGEYILSFDETPIENLLSEILIKKKMTLSVAESCTGGNLSHKLTLIPGASVFFKGGVVVYSNSLKENLLNVDAKTIDTFGAVSYETVEQMATGAIKKLESDVSISISGIAGPLGGSAEKPVGTVYIAFAKDGKIIENKRFNFGNFPREIIIERATSAAIIMAIHILK